MEWKRNLMLEAMAPRMILSSTVAISVHGWFQVSKSDSVLVKLCYLGCYGPPVHPFRALSGSAVSMQS